MGKDVRVYFGNVSVSEFEKITNITLTKEHKEWLESVRQDTAKITRKDRLHIFKEPFRVHCGSDIIDKFVKIMHTYDWTKTTVPLGVQEVLDYD